jgi:hypothetical protein
MDEKEIEAAMESAVPGGTCPVPGCGGNIQFVNGCCALLVCCDTHPASHQRFATAEEKAALYDQ